MLIRKLDMCDIEALSKLHKEVFGTSLFSVNFSLKKLNMYFNTLLSLNDYCFVAEDPNQTIVGYVIGGFRTDEAAALFMRKNKQTVLTTLILHPSLAFRGILRKLKHSFKVKKKTIIKLRLYLIGISPTLASKGLGSLLIAKFEEEIKKDGHSQYKLTVDKNNTKALNFYMKNGFCVACKENDDLCLEKKIN